MKTLFESQTCTRCGGSGKYSYCQSYGTKCFKCAGVGVTLTKRGKAAAAFLKSLQTIKASEVQFGMAVRTEIFSGDMVAVTYFRVENMETKLKAAKSLQSDGTWKEYNMISFGGKTPKGMETGLQCSPENEVQIVPTKAEKAVQVAKALEYQATLTKAGTPRKKGVAA